MKSFASSLPWLAAAALSLLTVSASANDKKGVVVELDSRGVPVSRQPLEERRIPAFQRIEKGLTPYHYEGRVSLRHDEISSNVLSVHVLASGGKSSRLRAGHSLAPNLHRIARP